MNASDMREEMQRVEEFAQGNLEEFRTVLGHYA